MYSNVALPSPVIHPRRARTAERTDGGSFGDADVDVGVPAGDAFLRPTAAGRVRASAPHPRTATAHTRVSLS